MKTNKKIGFVVISFLITFLLTGCLTLQKPGNALKPDSVQPPNNAVSKRFQDTASGSQTVVDSAIKLAHEHAELSEKMAAVQQKNQELIAENTQLKDRIAVLEPELKKTENELTVANDLLIEMRIELNNWKTNILGFRDEMRDADKAQLETLLKILEVLGGEVKPAKTAETASQSGDLIASSQKVQDKKISGETK